MAPAHLTAEEFEEAVDAGLDLIPDVLLDQIDNAAIIIEAEPDAEILTPEDYDADGLPTLLGFALRKTVPLVFIPVRGATTSKAPGPHRLAA